MSAMDKVQERLSYLQPIQCMPLLGVALISPIKAIVSTAQIAFALIGALFSLGYDVFSGADEISDRTKSLACHVIKGFAHLLSSIVNIATLGLSGSNFHALALQDYSYGKLGLQGDIRYRG